MKVESQRMEPLTNAITSLLAKPLTGVTASTASLVLLLIHVLTPVLAFLTLCFGCFAAYYSWKHNRNLVREDEQKLKGK